jgi:integrin beta 3
MKDPQSFAAQVGVIVRDFLGRQLAPVLERIAALEARPAPQPLEKIRALIALAVQPTIDAVNAAAARLPERGEKGAAGERGATGRDGLPGRDGRDGADGLGFDDLSVEYDGQRRLVLRFQKGTRTREFPIVLPVPIDAGAYRTEGVYVRGDGVSYGGAYWIAQRDAPPGKPGEGGETGWRLAVKRARDGRDGEKGEKGDPGAAGRAGRDLTQMGADGSKWA